MVSLTPLAPEDFQLAAGWLSDKAINRWLSSDWRDREITPVLIAVAVRNRRNRFFLVRWDSRPCGLVSFSDYDEVDRTAMIWYLLGEQSYRGKGVIADAIGKAVEWAFAQLGCVSIYAWIMADNWRSRRVLEKNGFREAGTLRLSVRSGDQQVDRVYFDLVKPGMS